MQPLQLHGFSGPSDRSRTCGLLNPIQARYQSALHPEIFSNSYSTTLRSKMQAFFAGKTKNLWYKIILFFDKIMLSFFSRICYAISRTNGGSLSFFSILLKKGLPLPGSPFFHDPLDPLGQIFTQIAGVAPFVSPSCGRYSPQLTEGYCPLTAYIHPDKSPKSNS